MLKGQHLAIAIAVASSAAAAFAPELVTLEAFDDVGGSMLVQAANAEDDTVRRCLAHPQAESFTLNLACAPGNRLYVNGHSQKPGDHRFSRDKSRHTQMIEIQCINPKSKDPLLPSSQKYALLVTSDWELGDIMVPKLTIDEFGADCVFEKDEFHCPDPKVDTIRLIATTEPSIKYVLKNSHDSVDIRLLKGKRTVPFNYSSKMTLIAEAGRYSKQWTVRFGGSIMPGLLNAIGWALAGLLALLLLSLLVVVGIAGIWGMGVPLGATEIAAALTLVMQYLCFANYLRETSSLESLATPMKWVTLFWPVPKGLDATSIPEHTQELTNDPHGGHFSSAYGISLFGSKSKLGDITDLHNAWGCVVWSLILAGGLLLFHGGVIATHKAAESRFTFPYRFRFGNWENRLLNWLAFPLATAATMLIAHKSTSASARSMGIVVMVALGVWILSVIVQISANVANKDVCWIWNSSLREAGKSEDQSGYWSDVECDQLLTQPVNRSLLRIFPYRWISTVADISPVSFTNALLDKSNDELYPPKKYKKGNYGSKPSYLLAKAPQIVSVVKTRKPGCYTGQRLMAGLLRTKWLDILFTFEGLTKFFTENHGHVEVPLVVKTSQLTGPIASGHNAFFYDGARVPFVRIAESMYKIFLGIGVGICAIPSQKATPQLVMYGAMAIVSLILMCHTAATRPYSRQLENWLVSAVCLVIGGTAASMYFYKYKDESCGADIFLWALTVCAVALSVYAGMVIFCIFTAVCCPPLQESRFLEKLSNCSVIVTENGGEDEYEMPGYTKYAAKDLVNQSKSGRVQLHKFGSLEELELHLDSRHIKNACKTGILPIP